MDAKYRIFLGLALISLIAWFFFGQKEPEKREVSTVGARRLALEISGMTCAACVLRVEKGLKRVPGVADANVNLASETAHVAAEPGVTVDDLV